MTEPVIETHDVVKTFGSTRALDGLDLSVERGEIHGFLGPNGAGKSTAIRVLLGIMRADSGHSRVLGGDPWADAVALHRRLAYVPGDVSLWPNLTGGEAIDLLGRLRGGINRRRRDELCELFELDPTKKARTYSTGNRQKVAIVSALSAEVELLILDEPTSGLDPLMEMKFQDRLLQTNAEGTTVLLSSHILAQVDALCERVSIIRQGQIVQSGSLADMRHLSRTTIEVETERSPVGLAELTGVQDFEQTDERVRLEVDAEHVQGVISKLGELGVRSIVAHPPTLEQLFLRHYGEMPSETSSG